MFHKSGLKAILIQVVKRLASFDDGNKKSHQYSWDDQHILELLLKVLHSVFVMDSNEGLL